MQKFDNCRGGRRAKSFFPPPIPALNFAAPSGSLRDYEQSMNYYGKRTVKEMWTHEDVAALKDCAPVCRVPAGTVFATKFAYVLIRSCRRVALVAWPRPAAHRPGN